MSDNSSSSRMPARRRKLFWIVPGLLVIGLLGWWGFVFLHFRSTHVTTQDAQVEANMISIASRTGGWVTCFDLIGADQIHKGNVLAVIYRKPAALALAELRAQRQALEQQMTTSRQQLSETRKTSADTIAAAKTAVDGAQARLASLKASLALAEDNAARGRSELKQSAISKQQYEKLMTTFRITRQNVRAAQAGVSSARADYAKARAQHDQVAVLQSRIKQYKAQLDALDQKISGAKTNLDDLVLRSPVDGVVDKTFVRQGDYVSPGQTLLMVHDPAHVWVTAKVKETALAPVKIGDPVQVSVDAYPGRVFHGTVSRVGTAATNQFALLPDPNPSGNFVKVIQRVPVRIAVKQVKGDLLRPGLNASVSIDIDGH
jgi:membrane fusion protein (multidrug efflux system)